MNSIFLQPCHIDEIIEIISELQNKDSLDIDEISTSLLKFVSQQICTPLVHIFNLSLEQGSVPDKLKFSKTVPVYKRAGAKSDMSNYRPISLVSSISKVLEKIIFKRVVFFLSNSGFFYHYQFGFLQGRSTAQALILLTDYIARAFNDNEIVIGVFLDTQKAFDCVDHDILFRKLYNAGIRGTALQWFKDFLSNRYQQVCVNGVWSTNKSLIDMSVLQGSIIGVLLFLIFINDQHNASVLRSILFADDNSVLAKNRDITELFNHVNVELQKMSVWYRSNKLSLNLSKTKYMVFHSKGKKIETDNLKLYFNNNDLNVPQVQDRIIELERITNDSVIPYIKVLGVYLDENLTFDCHVKHVISKMSTALFTIRRASNVLTEKAKMLLYYTMIHSHINYCLNVYSATSSSNLNKISIMQKKAVRTITGAKYNAHTAPLFKKLNILPLDSLVRYNKLIFMQHFVNDFLPDVFVNFVQRNNALRGFDGLRNAFDFYIPIGRTEYLKRFPFIQFGKCWNEFYNNNDPQIDFSLTRKKDEFKFKLKSYLISLLSDNIICNRFNCPVCN